MYLANISSAAILLFYYVAPSLAYGCCEVCTTSNPAGGKQKAGFDSCCSNAGGRKGFKTCKGHCVRGRGCKAGDD
ncbi:hypothetical protein Vi05172_g6719 [Venturia inaequalis]|nr:hypothetical protein Vi05172_g6719 [Venturia inaequalis]